MSDTSDPQSPPPSGPYPAQPGAYPPPPNAYAPQGSPYAQQYHPGYVPVRQGVNGLAIASMVLGILWIYWIGSILALIFGYVARKQIRENNQTGGGMAIAGIVLGWVGVGLFLLVIVIVALGSVSSGNNY